MKFLKICKNKKIITIVLSFLITMTTTILGHATEPNDYNINKNLVIEQQTNTNKIINIKTKREPKNINVTNRKQIKGLPMRVGATAYCGDTITSTGVTPVEGITIAVDPNVIPYGTRVYIPEFNKVFIAQDCGSAIKGNRIDIFMNSYSQAMEWGYKDITIYILD